MTLGISHGQVSATILHAFCSFAKRVVNEQSEHITGASSRTTYNLFARPILINLQLKQLLHRGAKNLRHPQGKQRGWDKFPSFDRI